MPMLRAAATGRSPTRCRLQMRHHAMQMGKGAAKAPPLSTISPRSICATCPIPIRSRRRTRRPRDWRKRCGHGCHAARVIHGRTCVMIVSDGYETDDAALLGREMAQLARRCRRIVWLNPMLGWQGYAPEAKGIKAAMPHVDLYAPAHTLASLAALEPYLARL